jgi:hypothetical protein
MSGGLGGGGATGVELSVKIALASGGDGGGGGGGGHLIMVELRNCRGRINKLFISRPRTLSPSLGGEAQGWKGGVRLKSSQ